MHYKNTKIQIPNDWTEQQAEAVVNFIDEILRAVWETHEDKIFNAIEKGQNNQNQKNDYPQEDQIF